MNKIAIPLQVRICFEDGKGVSIENIATAVKALELERKVAEAIIHRVDAELVERYCSEKHARGNGESRYQRAGSTGLHPVTSVGRLNLKLHKVKDTAKTENAFFKPVETRIAMGGKKIYKADISMISAELATKMTYRDAVKEGKQFLKDFPSACTIRSTAALSNMARGSKHLMQPR